MPTLVRLTKCRITMYADDHPPPHFHVLAHDGAEGLFAIGGMRVLSGELSPAAMKEVLSWARPNVFVLAAKWKELNQ